MTPEIILEKGEWPGSRDVELGGNTHSNESLIIIIIVIIILVRLTIFRALTYWAHRAVILAIA